MKRPITRRAGTDLLCRWHTGCMTSFGPSISSREKFRHSSPSHTCNPSHIDRLAHLFLQGKQKSNHSLCFCASETPCSKATTQHTLPPLVNTSIPHSGKQPKHICFLGLRSIRELFSLQIQGYCGLWHTRQIHPKVLKRQGPRRQPG